MIRKITYIFLTFFVTNLIAQNSSTFFEKNESFFPNNETINNEAIEWGFFTVPEDWKKPSGRKIKLAVAILKNKTNQKDTAPVIMIDGGPGGASIEGIWWWLNHPLREKKDIFLVDSRGTGFSEPRLCPDLGKELLKILAKNQDVVKDETDKVDAAMSCKQELLTKGVNVKAYHSNNLANDLHALKEYFHYKTWNVYGVSYGTHVAQEYSKIYPNDIRTLILDSPISDISTYYTKNTSNYVTSLNKLFEACRNDENCNKAYPNLKEVYIDVLKDLENNPITVEVASSVLKEGSFTYNKEDFKIAIHQALYQKKLVEVLPLLIYQFRQRNKEVLSALVAAFSGALSLDYGLYYCVTCNETIPKNPIKAYNEDIKSQKLISTGISFYKSDFLVCNQWNLNNESVQKTDSLTLKSNFPTLIMTGGFDPITPSKNGKELLATMENAQLIDADVSGHASSFSKVGFATVNSFVDAPLKKLPNNYNSEAINFANDIYLNGGISKMGNSLNSFNILFFTPFTIAFLILLITLISYIFQFIKRKKQKRINKLIKILLAISSLLSMLIMLGLIVGLNNTANSNFYILAFGLPKTYSLVFKLLFPLLIVLSISATIFLIKIKKIENRSILLSVLFSNAVIVSYFFYWGIIF